MKAKLTSYSNQREVLLKHITETLSKDERFVAAWLIGSYGKNRVDEVSDIDLSLVVAQDYSKTLCKKVEQTSHQTSTERLALFSEFGQPALIHENNNNAPKDATFTFVLYSNSALMVDWTIIPQENAERPLESLLLFEKINILVSSLPQPEELIKIQKTIAELWAFFWMMTAVTIKYIIRDDGVFANQWIENLHGIIHEIERLLNGKPWSYIRGSLSQLQPTREKQIESIMSLCKRMQELKPKVSEFIMSEPATPISEIETLLSLAKK